MTHYRPIHLDSMAEPIGITDQPAPQLQWVEIAAMVIDDRYQRPINHGGLRTIKAIAENFRWACFTPVLLAPIEGGRFAVIDGQHRVHAAHLCGIASVPAMVVPIAATEQARAFVTVNTARTSVSQYALFKAGLASGEAWAVAADRAVAQAGCKLMAFNPSSKSKKPGEIYAVGLIRDLVTRGHDTAVTVALRAIRAIEDTTTQSATVLLYSDWLLNPLLKAVADFPGLTADTLTTILRHKRPFLIMDAAERLAREEKRSLALTAREAFATTIRAHLMARNA